MVFFRNLRPFCVPIYMCTINNKTWAEHRLYVEIWTDITTQNSEREDT
jgi:hypothetical protein